MQFPEALSALIARRDLDASTVEGLVGQIMDGELSDAQKAALLTALAAKGESPEEIAGAARAMRGRVVRVPHSLERVVDTCGTGGDGTHTLNISTAAALVAAAAGASIAKHGNRSVSSRAGSADVLEALGVSLELEPEAAGRCLEEVGIAFLFAPRLHPAMREVMPVRKQLGVRTLFNILGPLTNPAGARRQLLGVFSGALVEPIARVLLELGAEHALVVHGSGLDEITTTGPTQVAEVRDGRVTSWELRPEELGLKRSALDDLRGGDVAENARRLESLLRGELPAGSPFAEVTALNAAAALLVAGLAADLGEGLLRAREVLASGGGFTKLEQLRDFAP